MQGIKMPLQLARKIAVMCCAGGRGTLHTLRAQHLKQLVVLDLKVLIKSQRIPEFLFQHSLLLLNHLKAVSDVSLPADSLAGLGY